MCIPHSNMFQIKPMGLFSNLLMKILKFWQSDLWKCFYIYDCKFLSDMSFQITSDRMVFWGISFATALLMCLRNFHLLLVFWGYLFSLCLFLVWIFLSHSCFSFFSLISQNMCVVSLLSPSAPYYQSQTGCSLVFSLCLLGMAAVILAFLSFLPYILQSITGSVPDYLIQHHTLEILCFLLGSEFFH